MTAKLSISVDPEVSNALTEGTLQQLTAANLDELNALTKLSVLLRVLLDPAISLEVEIIP